MFKRSYWISVLLVMFIYATSSATSITYTTSLIGGNRWQNTYGVSNDSLSLPIEEFTIWFELGLYGNLAVETENPLASDWDEIFWNPDPVFGNPGAYDALAIAPNSEISPGETVHGFSVSFDWLGSLDSTPGTQWYEIIDPGTFSTIDSGQTQAHVIPELPTGSGFLLALPGLYGYVRYRAFRFRL